MKRIDLTGKTYGKFKVIRLGYISPAPVSCGYWVTTCFCGKEFLANGFLLRKKMLKNCGDHPLPNRHSTHKMTGTSFYTVFRTMENRCNNINTKSYKHYGGRGIKCLWKSFEEFKIDMYESYLEHKKNNKKSSLDRIDNNSHYCKENCRWATQKEQCNNRRNTVYLDFNNKKMTISQWADNLNISEWVLRNRYNRKWSIEDIFNKPIRKNRYSYSE